MRANNFGYLAKGRQWVPLVFVMIYLLPQAVWAQMNPMTGPQVEKFQQALQQLATVQTLSVDFVQYKHLSFMKKPVESAGKLYVSHPHRLSWAYTVPFQYKMVFKDNRIFINDEGKKHRIDLDNSRQFEKISALVTNSMQGGKYDEREFAVAYFKEGNTDIVRLTPKLKDAKKYIQEVVVTFSSFDHRVMDVKLVEPSEDYTRFVLKNMQINKQIDDSVFDF